MVLPPLELNDCTTGDVNMPQKKKIPNAAIEYGTSTPHYDESQSNLPNVEEKHDPSTSLNIPLHKKLRKDENIPTLSFDNSIKEVLENVEKPKEIDERYKNIIKCIINTNKQSKINNDDMMKCSYCSKQYKSKMWLLKHLQDKKCLVLKKNYKGNDTAGPRNRNSTMRLCAGPSNRNSTVLLCNEAGPSTSSGNSNKESDSEEEEEEDNLVGLLKMLEMSIKWMNWKTLEFKSAGDIEFQKFVKIARSTTDPKYVNRKVERENLKKIRGRMVKLGVYMASPLRVNEPVDHLDAAFYFMLDAMGKLDMWNALSEADNGPYKLIASYMKAFIVNVNTQCCANSSMSNHVILKEADFRNSMLFETSLTKLFKWKSRMMDKSIRYKVRGTVTHIFREWTGERLEAHLLCHQYEYLKRKGIVQLTFDDQNKPSFVCTNVPDVADKDFVLLRSFWTTSYSAGYLELLRNSLYFFALPFLERVVETFVETGGLLNHTVVLAAVAGLNISWFHNENPMYELSDMYEHPGANDVRDFLPFINSAAELKYHDKARGKNIDF